MIQAGDDGGLDQSGSRGGDRWSDFGSGLTGYLITVSQGLRGVKDDPEVSGWKAGRAELSLIV